MTKFTPEQFNLAMQRAPAELFRAITQTLLQHARTFVQGTMLRKRLSGRPGLQTGSGAFRRSFGVAHTGSDLRTFSLLEYTTHPAAAAHEKGATIRPKKGQYLAIPIGEGKTASGVSRGGLRSYKETFVRPSPRRSALVVYEKRGDKAVPIFLLVRGIAIPARLGFADEWRADQAARKDAVGNAVLGVLAKIK